MLKDKSLVSKNQKEVDEKHKYRRLKKPKISIEKEIENIKEDKTKILLSFKNLEEQFIELKK